MSRRNRSDSAAASIAAMRVACENGIQPPDFIKLPDEAAPFWDAIILTKHPEAWTPNDLVVAAQLAVINCDIEKYGRILAVSSRLSKDERNSHKVSPIHKVINDLVAQSQSLARSLQIHARATQGESRDQKHRNSLFADSANAIASASDLIARPIH